MDVRVRYGTQSLSLIGLNRDLPFSTLNAIDVIFSDPVTVSLSQLGLTGVNVPSYSPSSVQLRPEHPRRDVDLPSAVGVDELLMALDGVSFADDPTIGVNPFSMGFAVLPGDINGDRVVNTQDLLLARDAVLGTGDPLMIGWADIDGSGVVDLNDYTAVRKRIGKRL